MNTDEIFEKLNSVVNRYVYEKRLFCGGCCFAAAVLAKELERLNIKYTIKVWQQGEAMYYRSIKKVCNSEDCAHIGIFMKYKGRKMAIGDITGVMGACNWAKVVWNTDFIIREYRAEKSINPDMLMRHYNDNYWNDAWKTENNSSFQMEIHNICKDF